MSTKSELRKNIIKLRNAMTAEEVQYKSKKIMEKLTSLECYKNSKLIFVFMSFGSEVVTVDLIKSMLAEGKRVVIPYTDTVNTVLIPSEIKSMDDLVLNPFGYYEPAFEKIQEVQPEEFDLIINPGVVFDRKLNRVGYGKGYYDRILVRKRKDAKAVAVAFELQVVDEVPTEAHDIKMDMIVTEESIYE